jgi:hypothetical protein
MNSYRVVVTFRSLDMNADRSDGKMRSCMRYFFIQLLRLQVPDVVRGMVGVAYPLIKRRVAPRSSILPPILPQFVFIYEVSFGTYRLKNTPTFMSNDPSNDAIFATEEALRMYRMENAAQVDLEALNLGTSTYHDALVEYTPSLVEETARLVYTHVIRDLKETEQNLVKDDRVAARYVQRVVQERLMEMKQRERDIDTRLNTVVTISEIGLLKEESYAILVEHLKAQVEIVQGMTSVLRRLEEILQMQNVYIWDLLAQLRELAIEI